MDATLDEIVASHAQAKRCRRRSAGVAVLRRRNISFKTLYAEERKRADIVRATALNA
jgi:hypothetical protein